MKKTNRDFSLAFSDAEGNIWDYPGREPAFRAGNRLVRLAPEEMIPLPYGSYLFSLPDRYPLSFNRRKQDFDPVTASPDGGAITAASAFLASAYLRTHLPA